MGLFDPFRQQRDKPQQSPSQGSSPNNETTRIDREHFVLQLPFRWEVVESEDVAQLELRNQDLPEQVVVTVWPTREPLSNELARRYAVERVVAARLQAHEQMSKGAEVYSPVTWNSGNDQMEARCIGIDQPQKVRFAFVVRAAPTKVVTVALTRYFLDEVGHPFEAYAGMIFDFLQVKPATAAAGG